VNDVAVDVTLQLEFDICIFMMPLGGVDSDLYFYVIVVVLHVKILLSL
jgi:hypothetical protein